MATKINRMPRGPAHYAWKGGRQINSGGYVLLWDPENPLANSKGMVLEHQKVWMEHNGPIPKGYIVHHRNEDRADNHIDNLRMLTRREHMREHRTGQPSPAKLNGRWSWWHARCAECDTTETPHAAKGLCDRCYANARYARRTRGGVPSLQ